MGGDDTVTRYAAIDDGTSAQAWAFEVPSGLAAALTPGTRVHARVNARLDKQLTVVPLRRLQATLPSSGHNEGCLLVPRHPELAPARAASNRQDWREGDNDAHMSRRRGGSRPVPGGLRVDGVTRHRRGQRPACGHGSGRRIAGAGAGARLAAG
jgi:hypothetical protein